MTGEPKAFAPSAAELARRWHFARAVLDELTLELIVDGAEADIERKPLEVLLHLLQHAGEMVTKEELLTAVWPGRILTDTVLTKAIGRIREAVRDEDQSVIKTVYGYGYRLVAAVRVEMLRAPERVHFNFSAGDHPPGRPLWSLMHRLGAGGHGEAWLGQHDKTREQRVFKFAIDEPSLTALKREITLFRFLNDSLGDRARIVPLIDWNLEQPPCFIESEYIVGGSLIDWAERSGGLSKIPLEIRIEVAAQIAEALASVHSVGVLHKDLKPSNILVDTRTVGAPAIRLADFGSGGVLDARQLEALGITRMGFTKTVAAINTTSGTPLYLAPELLAGQPPTVQADIYALGVMLYQLVIGEFRKAMSAGWEKEVDNELLRADIAEAAQGEFSRRLSDAAELAQRLRGLETRRQKLAAERQSQARAERASRALERAKAARMGLVLAFASLIAGLCISIALYVKAHRAQLRAEKAVETTQAVSNFLNNDVFGGIDPRKTGSMRDLTIEQVLDAATEQIDARFSDAPAVAAELHAAIGYSYLAIEVEAGQTQLERALEMFDAQLGSGSLPALRIMETLFSVRYKPDQQLMLQRKAETALRMSERHADVLEEDRLRFRIAIAEARYSIGEWQRSADDLRDLLSEFQHLPNPPPAAEVEQSLGKTLIWTADFADAELYLRNAMSQLRASKADELSLAAVRYRLGAVLLEQEKFDAAEAELSVADEIARRRLIPTSTLAINVGSTLGRLWLAQGRISQAVVKLEGVLAMFSTPERRKEEPQESAVFRYWLAEAYQRQGRTEAAEIELRGALQRSEEWNGKTFPITEMIRIRLADILRLLGQTVEATWLLDQVARDGLPGLPSDHPAAADLRRVRALILAKQGQVQLANTKMQEAMKIYVSRYGANDSRTHMAREEFRRAGLFISDESGYGPRA